MGLFRKKKQQQEEVKEVKDDALRDDISKAYDEIMAGSRGGEETKQEAPKPNNNDNFEAEVLKAKIRKFKEKKDQESLLEVIKMLPRRRFLLPSVSNIEQPFENVDGKVKLKKEAVITPALLTAADKKVFLPIFTDEKSMTQKSPSGIMLNFIFEQCVDIVYDEKNPVKAVVINPFTENMIIGEELLRMVFKKKEPQPAQGENNETTNENDNNN